MCKCPKCGAQLKVTTSTWTAKAQAFTMRGKDALTLETIPQPPRPTPIQPGAYIETPVAQQNIESNVKVPLAQSLITGGMIGGVSVCVSLFFGLPKPLLIIAGTTLVATYRTWTSGVGMADSLLTRIEDYTGIDINRDSVIGSQPPKRRQPVRLLPIRGMVKETNISTYEPEPQEQYIEIPGMPRADDDPWTVERMVNVLEQAFASGRWSRSHCKELGMSQGQWSALSAHLSPNDDGEGLDIWETTDRPTLDGFIEQVSGGVTQPTS